MKKEDKDYEERVKELEEEGLEKMRKENYKINEDTLFPIREEKIEIYDVNDDGSLKEFNLSERRKELLNEMKGHSKFGSIKGIFKLIEEQDKEFIKEEGSLILDLIAGIISERQFWERREKLAGKDLI